MENRSEGGSSRKAGDMGGIFGGRTLGVVVAAALVVLLIAMLWPNLMGTPADPTGRITGDQTGPTSTTAPPPTTPARP